MHVPDAPGRSWFRWLRARWPWLVGLAVVQLLIVVPTFPGRANHDTDQMVQDMDVGVYWDWWSPLLMMAWRPLYELGFGIGYTQMGTVAVAFAAVGSLIRPLFSRQWSAVLGAAVICLFPTVYTMLISVIRDSWFTVAVVATLAVIFRTRRPAPIHGALLLLGLASIVAARQNGALVVVVLTFAACANWGLLRVQSSAVRRIATWSAVSLAVGIAALVGVRVLYAVTDVVPTGPETATFYVDLDEMSTRVGRILVPDEFLVEPVTLTDLAAARNYTIESPLRERLVLRLPPADRPVVEQAWREAVREYPYVYLQARWQMFTRQIGWSGAPGESHYPTDGTSRIFHPRSPQLSELATGYLEMFDGGNWYQGGFLHRAWIYLAVAGLAAVRFGRRWPVLFAIPATQIAVLASLFFLSPIAKSRLVFAVYLLGLVAGAYALLGGRALLAERIRNDPGPDVTSSAHADIGRRPGGADSPTGSLDQTANPSADADDERPEVDAQRRVSQST